MMKVIVLPHPRASSDQWRVVPGTSFIVLYGDTATVSVDLENLSNECIAIKEGTPIAKIELGS